MHLPGAPYLDLILNMANSETLPRTPDTPKAETPSSNVLQPFL
jgi:hypothetical protein